MKTPLTIAGVVVLTVVAFAAFDRATDAVDNPLLAHPNAHVTKHYVPSQELLDRDRLESNILLGVGGVASVIDVLLMMQLYRNHSAKTK